MYDGAVFQANSSSGGVIGQFVANGDVNLGGTQTPGTLGTSAVLANQTSGYFGDLTAQKLTTTTGGSITSISTTFSTVDAVPNNLIQFGIYSDSSGYPGTLLATSAVVPAHLGLQTVPITATLAATTSYFIEFWTNGSGTNNSYANPGAGANTWYFINPYTWQCPSGCIGSNGVTSVTNGLPSPFPTGATGFNFTMNFQLNFEPAAALRVTLLPLSRCKTLAHKRFWALTPPAVR